MIQRHQQSMSRLFGKHWQSGGRLAPVIEYFPFWYTGGVYPSEDRLFFDPVQGCSLGLPDKKVNFPRYTIDNIVFGEYYPFMILSAYDVFFGGVPMPDLSAHEWFCNEYDIHCFKVPVIFSFWGEEKEFEVQCFVFCINSTNVKLDSSGRYYEPYDTGAAVRSPSCKWLVPHNIAIPFTFRRLPCQIIQQSFSNHYSYYGEITYDVMMNESVVESTGEKYYKHFFYDGNTSEVTLPDIAIAAKSGYGSHTDLLISNTIFGYPSVDLNESVLQLGTINIPETIMTLQPFYSIYNFYTSASGGFTRYLKVKCPQLGFACDQVKSPFRQNTRSYFKFDVNENEEAGILSRIVDFREI